MGRALGALAVPLVVQSCIAAPAFLSPRLPALPSRVGKLAATPVPVMVKNIDRTQQAFPDSIGVEDGAVDRLAEIAARKAELAASASHFQPLSLGGLDLVAAALLTVVLWYGVLNDLLFPRAARPSDLVLPGLGRLFGYNAEKDEWLADFEAGSRGEVPAPLLGIAVALFYGVALAVETGLRALYTGAPEDGPIFCIQLGVIGCLWAGVYEIGRIDTGYALKSRKEDAEAERVWTEFEDFANSRLERVSETKSVNQIEVVRAFRRFHARHRVNSEEAASDAAIVESLRRWYRMGYPLVSDGYGAVMSQAPTPTGSGFFKGVQLNEPTMF